MSHGSSTLDQARQAAGRYAWAEAFELFGAADAADPLGPADLNTMAQCAWWIGKMRHCIALRERAHAAYLKEEDPRGAARVAIDLADHHADLLEFPTATTWLQRAAKALEPLSEGPEHGWLKLIMALAGRGEGDLVQSNAFASEAREIAERVGDKDVFALALAFEGAGLVFMDEVDKGLAMVEEATVAAVAGDLGPLATGWIYCMMITVSAHVADWQRAGHWTEAATRWCDRQAISGFPGVCRVHRAEIMRLRGALSEAEQEASTATVELGSFNLMFTAVAFKELGEIRLRMGDLTAAEEAFRQASEMGQTPQPGLALAQLQRGNAKAAAASLRRALADEGMPALERAKILPAQVEVALALDDLETARAASAELGAIAPRYASPALHAVADASAAAVALAGGELDAAEEAAARACKLFTETDLQHEAARIALILGQVHAARGDREAAVRDIGSALSTLERIGAGPDADRARRALAAVS